MNEFILILGNGSNSDMSQRVEAKPRTDESDFYTILKLAFIQFTLLIFWNRIFQLDIILWLCHYSDLSSLFVLKLYKKHIWLQNVPMRISVQLNLLENIFFLQFHQMFEKWCNCSFTQQFLGLKQKRIQITMSLVFL